MARLGPSRWMLRGKFQIGCLTNRLFRRELRSGERRRLLILWPAHSTSTIISSSTGASRCQAVPPFQRRNAHACLCLACRPAKHFDHQIGKPVDHLRLVTKPSAELTIPSTLSMSLVSQSRFPLLRNMLWGSGLATLGRDGGQIAPPFSARDTAYFAGHEIS